MIVELSKEARWKAIEENCWFPGVEGSMANILRTRDWPIFPEGHGVYLRDSAGKEYIDATSGYYCVNLGYGNGKLIKAMKEQLEKIQYAGVGHSDTAIRLCQRIAEVTPGDLKRVYLGMGGSDAIEAALAIARGYYRSQGKPNSMVITTWQTYHGATLEAQALTTVNAPRAPRGTHGRELADVIRGVYPIFPPDCYRCGYGLEYPSCGLRCAKILDTVIRSMGAHNVMAFLAAPIAQPLNVVVPPDEYWPMIRQICDKHGVLLIQDEVINAWGRTGALFAGNHWNVVPDIMVTGKGLTSGYVPLSGVLVGDHVYQAFNGHVMPYYGHTYSFDVLGCACALASIDVVMEEKLWENATKVGGHIKTRLEEVAKQSNIIDAVNGKGLLIGLEIVEDRESKVPSPATREIIRKKCEENGVYAAHEFVLAPPLIMSMDEADWMCDVIVQAIKEAEMTKGLKRVFKTKRMLRK